MATVITTLSATTAHAAENQYWTESDERVGIIEQVMNVGTVKKGDWRLEIMYCLYQYNVV